MTNLITVSVDQNFLLVQNGDTERLVYHEDGALAGVTSDPQPRGRIERWLHKNGFAFDINQDKDGSRIISGKKHKDGGRAYSEWCFLDLTDKQRVLLKMYWF